MKPLDVSDQLRNVGLRVTAPRQSTLQWLAGHLHATAAQIRAGMAQDLGSVSTQTIYDVVHSHHLRRAGRLHRRRAGASH